MVDLIQPWLRPGHQIDLASEALSLHAFGELAENLSRMANARLILPPSDAGLSLFGSEADRAARNRLQGRWLASRCADWVEKTVEVRRADRPVPQGAVVLRNGDGSPQQAVLGSFSFSTDGLGLAPGNPLNLVQASETPEESERLYQWFDGQWSALAVGKAAKADIAIGQSGVEATETAGSATVVLDEADIELPDVLTELQDRTQLTRRSIQRILSASRRLDDFKRNPQQFIELAEQAINRCKQQALVDGIKYQRLGAEHYFAQELFEKEELTGYLKNMLAASKSIYEHVVYESGIEANFADQLEKNTAVKVYAKLPGWFVVPTPLGSYNPDWAVLIDSGEGERLYFVVETKGSPFLGDLRITESAKIECGKAHFNALKVGESPARYEVVTSVDGLLATIGAD